MTYSQGAGNGVAFRVARICGAAAPRRFSETGQAGMYGCFSAVQEEVEDGDIK
jgi:hypothetical protein